MSHNYYVPERIFFAEDRIVFLLKNNLDEGSRFIKVVPTSASDEIARHFTARFNLF
jgi:hypothetical protein